MSYIDKFKEGAKGPFIFTVSIVILMIICFLYVSSIPSQEGRDGIMNFVSSFLGLIVLGIIAIIGINITIFLGFLNAGGINHALGFYVMTTIISLFIV